MEQHIRFCKTSDGVRIAYATVGSGPPVVVVPGLLSHLELTWENEQLRRVWEAYARDFTVIRYDKRGTGLSDRSEDDYSLEARLRDLEAVVEDMHLSTFILRGTSEGGPVAIAYAARNSGRVLKLILFGTFASGSRLARLRGDVGEALTALVRAEWGLGSRAISDLLGLAPPPGFSSDIRERATSAEYFDAMIHAIAEIEVSNLLPAITAPTLIIHGRDDKAIPFELGKELAAAIPNARLVSFEGGHNPSDAKAIAEIVQTIRSFMLDLPSDNAMQVPDSSAVRTVLFTDLVGHVEMMQRLGDDKGRDVLREHERITRETLKAYGGAEVKTMGDGFMASFGSVTKAVDCAIALQRAFEAHSASMPEPLQVRVGLNAGEPIEEDGDLFGSTVILASRVAAQAGAGEILIPEPLRHLLSGKSYVYSDRGEVALKGFEDAVRLYEVRWRE